MSNPRALIDTGAIFAFVTRNDANHRRAEQFVKRWLKKRGSFVLPDLVFAETMTLLKARLGANIAVEVGRQLRANPLYQWFPIDSAAETETWAIFQRYRDKDWSYTDCALLAVARMEGIGEIFAFDSHFRQMPDLAMAPRPA